MTKQDMIDYCLSYSEVYEDYPFDESIALIRHRGNKKMFALVDYLEGKLQISLKCDPIKAELLRNVFESVIPGYHFNKRHWNTVFVDGDVPLDDLYEMIEHSYELTRPKPRPKKRVKAQPESM